MRIYIRDATRYYRYDASPEWARKHDNGCLVSIGLNMAEERKKGRLFNVPMDAVEVTHEEWNHGGCQSKCVLRGAAECRW